MTIPQHPRTGDWERRGSQYLRRTRRGNEARRSRSAPEKMTFTPRDTVCGAALFSAPVVVTLMNLPQMLVGNVCIHLRRRDGRMAEHSLHRANVGAAAQQIGCKCVTHGVRRHFFRNSRAARILVNDALNGAR